MAPNKFSELCKIISAAERGNFDFFDSAPIVKQWHALGWLYGLPALKGLD
jgi:hypothetical protein